MTFGASWRGFSALFGTLMSLGETLEYQQVFRGDLLSQFSAPHRTSIDLGNLFVTCHLSLKKPCHLPLNFPVVTVTCARSIVAVGADFYSGSHVLVQAFC